jgi:hypothetical protein
MLPRDPRHDAPAQVTLGDGRQPFAPLDPAGASALAAEEADVRRFLGAARYR